MSFMCRVVEKLRMLVLTFLFFICGHFATAQDRIAITIDGRIADTADVVLPSAHVTVTRFADSTLVTYTVANDVGQYQLTLPGGKFVLTASYTSYQSAARVIELSEGQPAPNTINFHLRPTTLEEVIVEGARPVTVRQDTLEFDAETFRSSADRTTEDLLKKVPGVDVRSDGKIYVRGQEVKDVLIEGSELYEDNPQLITRTLGAEAIDKVQVLDNYQPDGSDDERTAINLTIEEGHKNKLIGEATAGGGVPGRYLAETNGYLINPKLKANLIGNFNNVGQSTFSVEDYLSFSGLLDDAVAGGGGMIRLEDDEIPVELAEDEARPPGININTGALSLNYQVNDKLTARTFLIASHRRFDYRRQQEQLFSTEQLDAPLRETSSSTQTQRMLDWSTSLRYRPTPRHYLRYDLRGFASEQQRTAEIFTNFGGANNAFAEDRATERYTWQHELQWEYRIDPNNVLQAQAQLNTTTPTDQYRLQADNNPFAELLPMVLANPSPSSFRFGQRLQSPAQQAAATVAYRRTFSSHLGLVATGSGSRRSEETAHSFAPTEGDDDILTTSALNRSSTYTFGHLYGELALRYRNDHLEGQLGASLNHYQYDFSGQQNATSTQEIRLNPLAKLNVKFADTHRLRVSYELSNTFPNATQLNEAFLVDNYRRLVQGNGSLQPFQQHNFQLLYYRYDLFHHINASAFLQYRRSTEPLGESRLTTLNADLLQAANIQDESFLQSSVSLGKDFFFVPLSVKAEARYLQIASQNLFNGNINDFTTRDQSYEINVLTRYKQGLNATVGMEAKIRQLVTASEQGLPTNYFYRPSLELDYQFGEKLSVSAETSYLSFVQGEAPAQHFFFVNGHFRYRPTQKIELKLETFNALNTDQFVEAQVTPFYTETTTQDILDRYFLASVSVKF